MRAKALSMPLMALVVLLSAACSAGGAGEGAQAEGGDAAAAFPEGTAASAAGGAAEAADERVVEDVPQGGSAQAEGAEQSAAGGQAAGFGGEGGREGSALPQITQVAVGDRIIKDGTVELEVGEGAFDTAYSRVVRAAEALGGTVVSSETRNNAGEGPSGSVTVRVPVERYEQLLIGVREFGTVRGRRITSQDVSAEYVDLRARLRQQQAQERFYLGLLERAEDVEDAIAVQQQLVGLQTDIERIKGRLQFLDAKTTYSTLTVEIFEPGAPVVLAEPTGEPSLAAYWRSAVDGLVTVVGVILVTVVSVLPLLVVLGAAFAVWRAARRRPATVTVTEP